MKITNQEKKRKQIQKYSNANGITLIALIVMIIILLILASITVSLLLGDNGIIGRAKEASFKTRLSQIKEEWDLHIAELQMGSLGEYDIKNIYAGDVLIDIIYEENLPIKEKQVQDIKELITKVGEEEETYLIIHEGELYYVSQPKIPNNDIQVKWCQDINIKIWNYTPPTGMDSTNGSYEKVNDLWLCTPTLIRGFVKEKTRYMKEDASKNLVPGTWIIQKPEADWYDYKNQKWANLYVESNGIESYYVWIPRYVYKKDEINSTTENGRMDVKFVDINNNYKDPVTDEETSWKELQSQGYQIPEAFYFGDNEDYLKNKPIPGYWMSKYQLSDLAKGDKYTVDYGTVATPSSITIINITVNSEKLEAEGKEIAEYQYAINGEIIYRSSTPEDHRIEVSSKGDRAVNVTIVDAEGKVLGSMTKLYEAADINEPELKGFDPDTTFYVYWDEKGNEHNEIPIREKAPEQWYDYGVQRWANIVSRNNGLESYFVWIPRYQYALDGVSERSYVKFIKGTGRQTDSGYQIPEAFWWDKNDNGVQDDGEQLTGYWMSKYQLSSEDPTKLTTEITAGSNALHVQDIVGSLIENEGVQYTYQYYINGVQKHTGTSANEHYVFRGLKEDTTYTINIIVREKVSNKYIGAITKKLKTKTPYVPDTTGFDKETTFYVYWDSNGEEVRKPLTDPNPPKEWYSYSDKRWANIVTTANETETYFVWIPRYEYRTVSDKQRTDVNFVTTDVTNDNGKCTPGYQVPSAFSWGDNGEIQLKGYWMSKYQLSNTP